MVLPLSGIYMIMPFSKIFHIIKFAPENLAILTMLIVENEKFFSVCVCGWRGRSGSESCQKTVESFCGDQE